MAAGRNGTYSDMAELPFCADFHPSQSRRTGEIHYFVGSAVALDDVHASVNPGEDGSESKVVISTLKLDKPVDPELYRHLTGKSAL